MLPYGCEYKCNYLIAQIFFNKIIDYERFSVCEVNESKEVNFRIEGGYKHKKTLRNRSQRVFLCLQFLLLLNYRNSLGIITTVNQLKADCIDTGRQAAYVYTFFDKGLSIYNLQICAVVNSNLLNT